VDGNTGRVWGAAVRSDFTVTFGLPKRGNLLFPGADHCGRLYVSHISFPPELTGCQEITVEVEPPPPLPQRPPVGHTGTSGDALFIAGATGCFGAPAFAALATLRAGGGHPRLAAPRSLIPRIAPLAAEVSYAPQAETTDGNLAPAALDDLLKLAAAVDFIVVGPGLSPHPESQELVQRLLPLLDRPVLVVGHGLTAVAADRRGIRARPQPTILALAAADLARLSGTSSAQVQEDPIGAVQSVARDLGALVVLEGAHTLIGRPDGTVRINSRSGSAVATAGSGAILSGTIAAMYGLGLDIERAVQAGVFLYGLAGDLAAIEPGEDGVTARTILDALPDAVATYRESYAELTADACGALRTV
jgi:NAD(P)H-hydrate epimerase